MNVSDHDMKRTRPCLGCGGTGIGDHCPACLGTGTQQDRRTAAQAMVDAETLIAHDPVADFILRAGTWNDTTESWAFACIQSEEWSKATAMALAHAAFRAVPALRDGLEG